MKIEFDVNAEPLPAPNKIKYCLHITTKKIIKKLADNPELYYDTLHYFNTMERVFPSIAEDVERWMKNEC